ncbi:MAG: hypothetical protein Q8Q73_13760 [Stagnimonas sp.]|nr:hypothetical protein [Stagnimonas sp.]
MKSITSCALPEGALLLRYAGAQGYADCYRTEVPGPVSLAQYVEAFYTSPLFRLERGILKLAVARPSSDAQARQLGEGRIDAFAAWTVEARAPGQLLLCDYQGRTRSWLMVLPLPERTGTRLYFGSAVVPTPRSVQRGRPAMGWLFRALLGFHRLYSRLLLGAARAGLSGRA